MLIAYFDEVKHQPGVQQYMWLAGLVVEAQTVRSLEDKVTALAEECFHDSELSKATEFHAVAVFHRKENFKQWIDVGRRLDVLKRLIKILDDHERVRKVYVRLEPEEIIKTGNDLDQLAFMYFVEKVDSLATSLKEDCLLIGDHEKDSAGSIAARALSRFRRTGTEYYFGRPIRHLIDTVHFTRSHLSRMLQLADVYAWTLQLCSATRTSPQPERAEIVEFVRKNTKLLMAHRWKEWPSAAVWIRKAHN